MSLAGEFHRESKRQRKRGRCLHYDSGGRCNEIISAHSIQHSGQLNLIAEGGHVYQLHADLSSLKKTGGLPEPKKIGVNQVSTFAGFCKFHDNALFEPIDNYPLCSDRKQVALYAYRCLCHELFVKENAVAVMEKLKSYQGLSPQEMPMLYSSHFGHRVGLAGLNYHKILYDQALATEDYEQFEFTFFISTKPCNIQLSGQLYPDYDFEGYQLQDLGELAKPLDLITFFTAPTIEGWVFCFAWHVSSSKTCTQLLRSLASRVQNGENLQDALLRFSLSCCENHAIRISWWEQLSIESKRNALNRMQLMVSLDTPVPANYLNSGCEGIADWDFEFVETTM